MKWQSIMEKMTNQVIIHRKQIIVIFMVLMIIGLLCRPMIQVNYDMNAYLPKDAASSVALDVMQEEFKEGIPNARIMLEHVSIPEALAYKEKIEAVEGVSSVLWLDDAIDITQPLSMYDTEIIEPYYKNNTALFKVAIEKEFIIAGVDEIRKIVGADASMTGAAVSQAIATNSTVTEVSKMSTIAVISVILILILTTNSWMEPFVVLLGLGVAVAINAGSNLIFGEISFVTNAAGNILQLAVSLDYSIFLIHRFREILKDEPDPQIAMKQALLKSIGSISSSGLTTVIGFLALCFMRFGIGPDLGLALAKGICISLIVVFVFMPGIILITYEFIEKTTHKPLIKVNESFGKAVAMLTIPCTIAFLLMIVPSYLAGNSNDYYYGSSHIFGPGTKVGNDTERINAVFDKSDTYVLLVPKGDTGKEYRMIKEIQQNGSVSSVIAYVEQVGPQVPYEYLEEKTLKKLESEHYSRIVISVKSDFEGSETYALIDSIKEIAHNYYQDSYFLAGEGISTYDLKNTITADMRKVSLVSIGAIFLVLLFSLKTLIAPIILVFIIETAIWINLSVPYFCDKPIFYIAYLIISSVQLGATVDYAILMTDRYKENRRQLEKRPALEKTVSDVIISILTSGILLTFVGFLLGTVSSHGVLSQLGYLIGRGAICSLLLVVFVLPRLLYTFDRFVTGNGTFKTISAKFHNNEIDSTERCM